MLFLLPLPIQTPPAFVSTAVRAFGMYGGSDFDPRDEAGNRTGTLILVRRARAGGSTVTDLRVLPAQGRRLALYATSRGQIVRDAKGEVAHIEVWSRTNVSGRGMEGTGVWDRPKLEEAKGPEDEPLPPKSSFLVGWSKSTWDARHSVNLPTDGFYSLGAIEALAFDPSRTEWRVPAPADLHYVWRSGARTVPYEDYSLGSGVQGVYEFKGRAQPLRVCPVFLKGSPAGRATVNGRSFPFYHVAVALFDPSGGLAGFGYTGGSSTELDSLNWGGHAGSTIPPPPATRVPNPWRDLFISSFVAPVSLSPAEQDTVLKSL